MTEIDFLSSLIDGPVVRVVGTGPMAAFSAISSGAEVSSVGRGATSPGWMHAPRHVFPRRSGELDG
jgi:hypothetical protein